MTEMKYELKKLTINDNRDIYEMLQEIPAEENGFINSNNGRSFEDFKTWLNRSDNMSKGIGLESWMVPSTTYWLFIDGRPVGMGKLRHRLTEKLMEEGGHVGYSIRPAERGKGYGKLLLKLLIEQARAMDIKRVLITVRNHNTPSIKTALANGGKIEKTNDIRHFIWIDC